MGIKPPLGIWAHICGSDLVRDKDGTVYVLEDNLRVPSGVSYMLENRRWSEARVPGAVRERGDPARRRLPLAALRHADRALARARSTSRGRGADAGHLQLGVLRARVSRAARWAASSSRAATSSVESDDCVYMQTVRGWTRVDVIYRRIDDDFLDPEVFRKDSALGVPGLMRAWRAGNVALANAPGAGVADDKVVYAYVPRDDQVLPGRGRHPAERAVAVAAATRSSRKHVLGNLDQLVVKPADELGRLRHADRAACRRRPSARKFADSLKANPRNYIAQPVGRLCLPCRRW